MTAVGSRKEATRSRRRMRVSRLHIQAIPGSKSAADVPGELPPPPPGRYFIHVAAAKARRPRRVRMMKIWLPDSLLLSSSFLCWNGDEDSR
jgi:hypothetical protein